MSLISRISLNQNTQHSSNVWRATCVVMMGRELCIVSVSYWDNIRIHFLSLFFGGWVFFKRFVKWIWDPNGFFKLQLRDKPPDCLVDSTLGQHKYVKLKGVKFHYVESGSKENPLIILLHGFPDCWLSWRYQIPALSENFHLIALDLKGFGDSDKPLSKRSYRIEVILEELKQLIASLGVSSTTIIGHDLGALLGWYFVHQYPEMVDKFFAVSCPHPNIYWKSLSTTLNYQWVNFAQLPYLPEIDALKEDVRIITDYHNYLPAKDVYLEAYKYSFSRKEDWTGPINYYRNLPFTKISDNCEQINVTTVLVTGNKDNFLKLEDIVKSTEFCEKFYMKIIDGAGHFPHQESPEMFNKILLKYLRKHSITKNVDRSPSKYLMDRMFGAVSNISTYGNSVLDSVQKRTNGVVNNLHNFNLGSSSNSNNEDVTDSFKFS
ncbi:unnamed protein product [Brassicogethes aeneus]|uniref:AB hydrolase-1 domain-containing protein n=1 Tax=Brassicogethes aeneus TaxID=1431903 RepID=A0A9P0FKQ3_BRAAE|nr:unnamed protein product [Brassicogethes aeneus]